MPRILYLVFFVILTFLPFPFIWVGQALFNIQAPNTATNITYNRYHSHPFYGGFFYFGDHGRGGWLGRSYRNFGETSSNLYHGTSRSYSGGSSSFSGGSFGAFGK